MSAAPGRSHQRISFKVAMALDAALPPEVQVIEGWGWKPASDEFVPDVMVVDRNDEETRYTAIPHLIVEVLSSDPACDMLRKLHKYEAAGVPRYWIIDPAGPEIHVYEFTDNSLRHVATHTGDSEVSLDAGPATVTIAPASLID